jgi:ribosomal protein S18 acetylase RimI-like enzyme
MIQIREMKIEDIPTLHRWGNSTPELWGSEETKWHTQKGLMEMLEHKDKDIQLVVEVDGRLAGMCLSRFMFEWYYCSALYVDSPHRGKGIATMLLMETEKQARAKGVNNLGFDAKADNVPAIALYEKIGFKKCHKSLWFEKKF